MLVMDPHGILPFFPRKKRETERHAIEKLMQEEKKGRDNGKIFIATTANKCSSYCVLGTELKT